MATSNKKRTYISIDRIVKYDWDDISKMRYGELLSLTKASIAKAKERQTKLKKYLYENDMTLPTVFRDNSEKLKKLTSGKYRQIEKFTSYDEYDFSLDKRFISDINYLRYKFKMTQQFLRAKTSTVKGFEKVLKQTSATIEKRAGIKLQALNKNTSLTNTIWKLYTQLRKSKASDWGTLGSSVAISYIDNYVYNNPDKSFEEMYFDLLDNSSIAYNEWIERHNSDEVDDIFELGDL